MTSTKWGDTPVADEPGSGSRRSRWLLLLAIPLAGAVFWFWPGDASDEIDADIARIAASFERPDHTSVASSDDGDDPPSQGGGGSPSWQTIEDFDDDDQELASDMSPSDARVIVRSAQSLAALPNGIANPNFPGNPRIRKLVRAARRVAGQAKPTSILQTVEVGELSRAEQIELARISEARIAQIGAQFETASLDQAIENLIRAEANLNVLHKDIAQSVTDKRLPNNALALAPTASLESALEGLRIKRRHVAEMQALAKADGGGVLAHVDVWIERIQNAVESGEHQAFREQRAQILRKVSKKTWDTTVTGFEHRVQLAIERRYSELQADTGWQEIRFSANGIRGPPGGSLDARPALNALREFDLAPRSWLQAEAAIQALGDELGSDPKFRKLMPGRRDGVERVTLLLDDATLRSGKALADAVLSDLPELPEKLLFPGKREHFESYSRAFTAELQRRKNGGTRVVRSSELAELVKTYAQSQQPARAEAKLLSLASLRFPHEQTIPAGVREDIRNIQSRTVKAYTGQITKLLDSYCEVADHLALAADAAPDLLKKLKLAGRQLKAASREFLTVVSDAKRNGVEVDSAKAILVKLESLFPRGPPGDGPLPPVASEPPTHIPPKPSNGGGSLAVNSADLKRLKSVNNVVGRTNPSLEKNLFYTEAYLTEAGQLLASTKQRSATLDQAPPKFAQQKGRRTYDPSEVVLAKSGDPDWKSIAQDTKKARLRKSHKNWEGRLKTDTVTGHKRPYDFRSEVKNPRSFRAVGGGIHYGEIANPEFEFVTGVYALRFDSGELVLVDGRTGERLVVSAASDINSTALKALYRFAKSGRNAAISIGWGTEQLSVIEQMMSAKEGDGSAILLDPYLVDTSVGQDLILADSIPWKFDTPKLPNGRNVPFHVEFKREYNEYRRQRLQDVKPLFESVTPFRKEQRQYWAEHVGSTMFSPVIYAVLRADSVDEARSVYVEKEMEDVDDELRRMVEAKVLEANGIDDRNYLSAEGKQIVDKAIADILRKLFAAQFDEVKEAFGDEGASFEDKFLPLVDLSMAALLSEKKSCPRTLIELWAALLLAKDTTGQVNTDTLAVAFLGRLNSTTLAMLYDDLVDIGVEHGTVILTPKMRYRYATTFVHVGNTVVSVGRPNDPKNEVKTIDTLTSIANQGIADVTGLYEPLQRVADQAAVTAFLKWAIREKEVGTLIIDLSELAAVPGHDPNAYPTPDAILK